MQYGPVWVVTAPSKPWIVVVSDTPSLDHVLRTNFDNYIKGVSPPHLELELALSYARSRTHVLAVTDHLVTTAQGPT
jgi:hypothetical protein